MDAFSSCNHLRFQASSPPPASTTEDPTNSSSYNSSSSTIVNDNFQLASANPKKRAGRKIFKETRHPVYRGVRQRNSGKWPKWVCEVREPTNQKRIWLGSFPTVEMAARAYDVATIALRGRSACLNFADSAWRLPVPASNDIKDIQKAATLAAEFFRPSEEVALAAEEVPAMEESQFHCSAAQPVETTEEESSSNNNNNNGFYMEEEDVFRMPAYLADMYTGMTHLPPPYLTAGFDHHFVTDNDDDAHDDDSVRLGFDSSVWNYSA